MGKFIRAAFLVVLSLAATLFILELFMRVFQYKPKVVWWQWVTDPDNQKFVLDTQRIYRLKKGIIVDFEKNTPTQTIDAEGRRTSPCAADSEVWLFVGDSFVYGHGVQDGETFPVYVYREMMDRGKQICVVNAGVQGYSLGPSYVAFREALTKIRPDVVVWGIRSDDLLDTSQDGVIKINKDSVIVRGAWTSGVFLQGVLNKTIGRVFPHSLLLNTVMYFLQADKVSSGYINEKARTLPSFLSHLGSLSQTHSFTLYYVITPSQSVIVDPIRKDNPENEMYASLRRALQANKRLFLDMNAVLSPVYYAHLESILGVRADSIFQPDGHLTASGNMLMGKLFYETISSGR